MRLSFPWERVIITNRANPILASHAPRVKMTRGGKISDLVIINIVMVRTIVARVKASRFNKHWRKLW